MSPLGLPWDWTIACRALSTPYGRQQFPAWSQWDLHLLQVLIRQKAQAVEVDLVHVESLSVLLKPKPRSHLATSSIG